MIIMQKTAGALAYAHRHQVAHRGLNSHAILVQLPGWPDSEPRVELADWSWAGRVHQKGTAPATQSRGDRTGRPERRAGSTAPNSSVSPRRGDDGRTGRMHQPGRSEMADPLLVAAGPVAVGFAGVRRGCDRSASSGRGLLISSTSSPRLPGRCAPLTSCRSTTPEGESPTEEEVAMGLERGPQTL